MKDQDKLQQLPSRLNQELNESLALLWDLLGTNTQGEKIDGKGFKAIPPVDITPEKES